MSILYALAGIRTSFLDRVMLVLTNFGDETILLILAMSMFWCINKRWGFRLMVTAFAAMSLTMLLKELVMAPRPWMVDPAFKAVEEALERAYDYSFPSGHSTVSAILFGTLAMYTDRKPLKIFFVCFALLVGFTRLYLGVHHPEDVAVGLLLGFGIALLFRPLFNKTESSGKASTLLHSSVTAFIVLSIIIQLLKPASSRSVAEQDARTLTDTYSLLGASACLILGHWMDRTHIHFPNEATLPVKLLRLLGGFALVMAVRVGLKAILPSAPWASMVRYFMMMFVGTILWPMAFPCLDRISKDPRKD